LLTAFASLTSAAAAVRAGAWAYLLKPCATTDLLLAVEQAVRQVRVLEDRRALQQRTKVAEKLAAVGTLAAGLSHEIKNPLNAAKLQLRVVEERLRQYPDELQPPIRQPLQLVEDEIGRLNQLLEEFLAFARPRELDAMAMDLVPVLERVSDLFSAEASDRKLHFERQWPASLPLYGEEQRLQQVLVNLIRNAIQATPSEGTVRVRANAEGSLVTIVVEDTGPGIAESLRARVFEPFFTTKASGSGLGLPLVYSIVEQHRGSVAIEAGEHGGARLVVRLPTIAS
jgi:signal transduction histidine kinase